MDALKMILDFILSLSDNREGTVLMLLWLFICLSVILIFVFVCNILTLMRTIADNRRVNKEINLKRNIYHRYADIAREARLAGRYAEATEIMNQCTISLFGNHKNETDKTGDDDNDTKSDVSTGIEEPVSRESGQSSDRPSDGPKESFVKITD